MKRLNKLHEARAIISSNVRSAIVQIQRLQLHDADLKRIENLIHELEDRCTDICVRLDFLIAVQSKKEKQKRLNLSQRIDDNSSLDSNSRIIKIEVNNE